MEYNYGLGDTILNYKNYPDPPYKVITIDFSYGMDHYTVYYPLGQRYKEDTLLDRLEKGVRTKLKNKYANVNLDGENPINRKAQAYLIAVAVQEKGLDFIDCASSEIRNISEEYINTGLLEMEKIFLNNKDNTIALNKLMLILKKKFK